MATPDDAPAVSDQAVRLRSFLRSRCGSLRSAFDALDARDLGHLSPEGFAAGLSRLGFEGDAAALFQRLDSAGRGVVSFRTFMEHVGGVAVRPEAGSVSERGASRDVVVPGLGVRGAPGAGPTLDGEPSRLPPPRRKSLPVPMVAGLPPPGGALPPRSPERGAAPEAPERGAVEGALGAERMMFARLARVEEQLARLQQGQAIDSARNTDFSEQLNSLRRHVVETTQGSLHTERSVRESAMERLRREVFERQDDVVRQLREELLGSGARRDGGSTARSDDSDALFDLQAEVRQLGFAMQSARGELETLAARGVETQARLDDLQDAVGRLGAPRAGSDLAEVRDRLQRLERDDRLAAIDMGLGRVCGDLRAHRETIDLTRRELRALADDVRQRSKASAPTVDTERDWDWESGSLPGSRNSSDGATETAPGHWTQRSGPVLLGSAMMAAPRAQSCADAVKAPPAQEAPCADAVSMLRALREENLRLREANVEMRELAAATGRPQHAVAAALDGDGDWSPAPPQKAPLAAQVLGPCPQVLAAPVPLPVHQPALSPQPAPALRRMPSQGSGVAATMQVQAASPLRPPAVRVLRP